MEAAEYQRALVLHAAAAAEVKDSLVAELREQAREASWLVL